MDPKALREPVRVDAQGVLRPRPSAISRPAGEMRDHLTKAVGLHVADEVWTGGSAKLIEVALVRRSNPRS